MAQSDWSMISPPITAPLLQSDCLGGRCNDDAELRSADINADTAALYLGRIDPEINASGEPQRFARPVVEGSLVLGALDLVIHDQAVGEMDLFVGAEPIGAEHQIVGRAVDRIGLPSWSKRIAPSCSMSSRAPTSIQMVMVSPSLTAG
jgi:hypothetical protein